MEFADRLKGLSSGEEWMSVESVSRQQKKKKGRKPTAALRRGRGRSRKSLARTRGEKKKWPWKLDGAQKEEKKEGDQPLSHFASS